MAKRLIPSVLWLFSASLPGCAQDIQDLRTAPGILSWMFDLQSIDFKPIAIFILAVVIAVLAVIVLGSLFWIRMLSDALSRKFENGNDKIAWVIVITFTHGLGAMLYYKMVKIKSKPPIIPKTR